MLSLDETAVFYINKNEAQKVLQEKELQLLSRLQGSGLVRSIDESGSPVKANQSRKAERDMFYAVAPNHRRP